MAAMNNSIPSRRQRPPLAERLRVGLEDTLEWTRGETEARVTLLTNAGERIGPELMTRTQYETLLIIADMLEWTGRAAATLDEAEKVNGLRHRAETLLKQAGIS